MPGKFYKMVMQASSCPFFGWRHGPSMSGCASLWIASTSRLPARLLAWPPPPKWRVDLLVPTQQPAPQVGKALLDQALCEHLKCKPLCQDLPLLHFTVSGAHQCTGPSWLSMVQLLVATTHEGCRTVAVILQYHSSAGALTLGSLRVGLTSNAT